GPGQEELISIPRVQVRSREDLILAPFLRAAGGRVAMSVTRVVRTWVISLAISLAWAGLGAKGGVVLAVGAHPSKVRIAITVLRLGFSKLLSVAPPRLRCPMEAVAARSMSRFLRVWIRAPRSG